MKKLYYLVIDNCMQLIPAIVEIEEGECTQFIEIPNRLDAKIIQDIFSREIHFPNREIRNMSYAGYTISKTEFDHIKELVSLYPMNQKFITLCQ